MKRNTVSVAVIGVAETQSRALVAASSVIQSRLPADLQWESDAAHAEIIILNTGDPDGQNLASRFAAENDAVIVPYAEHGDCPEHGIARPLRMNALQDALMTALKHVLDRPPPSQEDVQRRSYRGHALEGHAPKPKTHDHAAPAGFSRMYRGRPA